MNRDYQPRHLTDPLAYFQPLVDAIRNARARGDQIQFTRPAGQPTAGVSYFFLHEETYQPRHT